MGAHRARRSPTRLAVLLTAAPDGSGRLAYRADLLASDGFEVCAGPPRAVARTGGRASVLVSTVRSWRCRRAADVTLAMFESEGHLLALLRGFVPRRLRRRRLVIVSCWLAELADRASVRRRVMYRWIYRGVDLVTVFSANQVEVLGGRLGIDRVAVIPFGVDVDELLAIPTAAGGPPVVLAVGRDAGRDWPTLLAAVTGTGWNVELVTRRRQIDGLVVPTEVTLVGTEPRPDYLRRLAAATVVVIPSHELAYPSGQTVLLEAMALGKACVVTTTQALADYTRPGRDCVGVPVGDAAALRRAVSELLGDATLRDQLGREAAAIVRSNFSATQMWAAVADRVRAMLDE